MKTTTFSFAVLTAIIAVTILQACATTTTTTQCAKPTLTPAGYNGPLHSVTVTIKTATTGAYLRYTLDGSTPTSSDGTLIPAASGKASFHIWPPGKTLKAIAYKAGWTTSLIAVGNYVYESGGNSNSHYHAQPDANLTRAETRPVLRVVDCLLLTQEDGLHARRLIHLPAVSEWSDFDYCHRQFGLFSPPKQHNRSFEHERAK